MSLRYGSEARHSFGTTASATTINALAAITGFRLFVYRLLVTTSVACTFKLQDTGSTDMSQAFQLAVNGGIALDVPFNQDPWWFTGQGGTTPLAGQGLGINFIVVGTTPTIGWDIWWDAHP